VLRIVCCLATLGSNKLPLFASELPPKRLKIFRFRIQIIYASVLSRIISKTNKNVPMSDNGAHELMWKASQEKFILWN
jgi:hypothetical protein